MSAASFLTKVVIMDFFCFDITENIFVSNIDLIDYLMVVSIIVVLPTDGLIDLVPLYQLLW